MLKKLFCFTCCLLVLYRLPAQAPRLVLPIGHTNDVIKAQYSPDGKMVLTSSWDRSLKIWDAKTGMILQEIDSKSQEAGQFSPDGSKVLAISGDTVMNIWNVTTADIYISIHETNPITCARFSPDGKRVAICTDEMIKVWDLLTGEGIITIGDEEVRSDSWFEFSPDSKKIFSYGLNNSVTIWDVDVGERINYLIAEYEDIYPESVIFLSDNKTVLIPYSNGTIKVWDATGRIDPLLLTFAFKGFNKIQKLLVSRDEKHMLVISSNDKSSILKESKKISIWDIVTGKHLYDLISPDTTHINGVRSAYFSPDGKKIITASGDGSANTWDARNGKLLIQFKQPYSFFHDAEFSPDGKYVVTASGKQSATIWNATTGKPLMNLSGHVQGFEEVQFSPDGKNIITTYGKAGDVFWDRSSGLPLMGKEKVNHASNKILFTKDGRLYVSAEEENTKIRNSSSHDSLTVLSNEKGPIWGIPLSMDFSPDGKRLVISEYDSTAIVFDVASGKSLFSLSGHTGTVYNALFSPDGNKIITYSNDNLVKVWNAKTGLLQFDIPDSQYARSALFSPDGKKVLVGELDTARIYDAETGKYLMVLAEEKEEDQYNVLEFALFSPDGKKVAIVRNVSLKGIATIWDTETGKLLSTLSHTSSIRSLKFSSDSKIILTASWDYTAKVWNAETGSLLANLNAHSNMVNNANFSPDNKTIITCSSDNTAKVWNTVDGKLIYTFFVVDSADYFILSPQGYYLTTPAASKLLHYVSKGAKVITFEQLDVKYNRPDKVLEAIGNTDTALIKSYRKAYEKRIKKLGIDTTAFRDGYSVPEADFVNRDVVGYEQIAGMLTLHIKGNDSIYKLERFNIWVNEAPIFGQRGINIRRRNKNDFDTTINIRLSQGENRIETSIINVNGTESYRMPLSVNYIPRIKQKEMLRFIGIGIDRFVDNKYNLQYSSKDIRDLSKKLKEKYKENIIIDTLFNENVTVSNVKALKQKLLQTTENDKVIVAYSGHGMLSKDYDYYLSTYSVNFDKPEENGLPYDELENLLDSIPARKKLMLIDACHSGEVDKEDLITLKATPDSLIKGLKPVAYKKEGQLGLKNSFELMQSLFVNVGKSTGATIISAAAGTQFALERNDLKNGVFTYSILEAMNKYPEMKISELKTIVGKRVEELTKGLQKPTSRNETIAVDWNVW